MLKVYIEKAFLDDFKEFYIKENTHPSDKIIMDIFKDYPETNFYIDIDFKSTQDYDQLIKENPYFLLLKKTHQFPIYIESFEKNIEKHYRKNCIIVLTKNPKDWFDKFKKSGVICLTSSNYRKQIQNFIKNYQYRYDFNEDNFEWDYLNFYPSPKYFINDNYILLDQNHNSIEENLIPIFNKIISPYANTTIHIYTKILDNKISNLWNAYQNIELKQLAESKLELLNKELSELNAKFFIVYNSVPPIKYQFHDRVIFSNYQTLDSGIGFGIFRNGRRKKSNSQVISDTIFNLYTYKRIKNLKRAYKDYLDKISAIRNNNYLTIVH